MSSLFKRKLFQLSLTHSTEFDLQFTFTTSPSSAATSAHKSAEVLKRMFSRKVVNSGGEHNDNSKAWNLSWQTVVPNWRFAYAQTQPKLTTEIVVHMWTSSYALHYANWFRCLNMHNWTQQHHSWPIQTICSKQNKKQQLCSKWVSDWVSEWVVS